MAFMVTQRETPMGRVRPVLTERPAGVKNPSTQRGESAETGVFRMFTSPSPCPNLKPSRQFCSQCLCVRTLLMISYHYYRTTPQPPQAWKNTMANVPKQCISKGDRNDFVTDYDMTSPEEDFA
jgi:hypothetical protein